MPGVSELARQAAEAEQPLFGAPERSRRYDAFAVSQRAVGESLVHPSHRVIDEDMIGIASDPVCQVCRRSLFDSMDALREPCVPVRCTCWPANGCNKCVPALAAPIDDDGFITPDVYLGNKPDLSTLSLPDADELRGQYPMADGLLDYFPNALAEVSKVSKIGNDQHNPGEPMHWARDKSTDHHNKILRHLVDRGKFDGRGVRHTARLAWRALAMLQDELEADEGFPRSRASA